MNMKTSSLLIMYLVTIILVLITLLIIEDDCGCDSLSGAKTKTIIIDHDNTGRSFSFGSLGTAIISQEDMGSNNNIGIASKTGQEAPKKAKIYELSNPETVCQDKIIMRDKKLSRNQALSAIFMAREEEKKSKVNEISNWVRISGNTRIYGYDEELDGII